MSEKELNTSDLAAREMLRFDVFRCLRCRDVAEGYVTLGGPLNTRVPVCSDCSESSVREAYAKLGDFDVANLPFEDGMVDFRKSDGNRLEKHPQINYVPLWSDGDG